MTGQIPAKVAGEPLPGESTPGPSPAGASAVPERVAFAALHDRGYRIYFVATILAMMGDNIEHVISYWVMFHAFHSPFLGGFAVVSHWTPFLLLAVYFGGLADRYDCRRIIQTAQIIFMSVSLAWGLLFLTNSARVWHAVVLLSAHGMAGVLAAPATQVFIHDIVGSEHLQSAVRLNATARQLGVLLGPAVGGGLMLLLGPSVGVLVNVLVYLPLTVWLATVPYTGHSKESGGDKGRAGRPGLKDGLELVRQVAGNRAILSMILLAGVSSLFVGNAFHAQMPEFAQDLGTDKAGVAYSLLLAANAAGAVVGGLLLEGGGLLGPRVRTAIVAASLWCVAIVGFAAATRYAVALTFLFFAGILNLTFNSMSQTLVQLLAPVDLRGRLIGLYNMSNQGLRAFSGITVGVLGGFIGVHWSLGLSAAALLGVTVALFVFAISAKGAQSVERV